MKNKLIKVLAAVLSVFVILPMINIKTVNAAKTGADLRYYIWTNGTTVSSDVKAITYHHLDDVNFLDVTAQISMDRRNQIITFKHTSFQTDGGASTSFIQFKYDVTSGKILNDNMDISGTVNANLYSASYRCAIDLNFIPKKTALDFIPVQINGNPSQRLLDDAKLAMVLGVNYSFDDFETMLRAKGYSLSMLGFTADCFRTTPAPSSATWLYTDLASAKVYTDANHLGLKLQFPEGTDVTGLTYSVVYGSSVIATGTGPEISLWAANAGFNGNFPGGTYAVEFKDSFDMTVYSDTCTVYSSGNLPAFNPAASGSGVDGFVDRLYSVVMNRQGDSAGKAYWVNLLTSKSLTGADAAREFLLSDEFTSKYYTNDTFIEVLYRLFFNRSTASDPSGKAYWVGLLNGGASRQDVIGGFVNSNEWATICLQYGIASGGTGTPVIPQAVRDFATRLYSTCLGRAGDEAGINYWTTELAARRISGRTAAHEFFFSNEFIDGNHSDREFVARLYRTFMGRDGSEDEINYWASLLVNQSREAIFNGFAASDEFANLCRSAGINP